MTFAQLKYLFRCLAFLEGLSFIVLVFIAMPLKYIGQDEILVKLFGMPHGILFILYVIAVILLKSKMKWNKITTVILLIASIIPFGTFYVDYKYLRMNSAKNNNVGKENLFISLLFGFLTFIIIGIATKFSDTPFLKIIPAVSAYLVFKLIRIQKKTN